MRKEVRLRRFRDVTRHVKGPNKRRKLQTGKILISTIKDDPHQLPCFESERRSEGFAGQRVRHAASRTDQHNTASSRKMMNLHFVCAGSQQTKIASFLSLKYYGQCWCQRVPPNNRLTLSMQRVMVWCILN